MNVRSDMPRPLSPLRAGRRPAAVPLVSPEERRETVDSGPVASLRESDGPAPRAKWTVLNYCAADNNLYAYIYDDVAGMEEVGSSNAVQLVAQFDHQNAGAYRFRIEKDRTPSPQRIDSPVVEALGPVNMSDPKTLADFIAWGMKKYPSERTMLVIADHGKGWQGLIQDESHRGWMTTPQLKQALEMAEKQTGKKLDVIGFDACLMASAEVASEIKDHAGYMVASQALEGREGWPYQHMLGLAPLQELKQAHLFKSDVEARQAVQLVVKSAADNPQTLPTMSAIDLSQMADLEKKLKGLVDTVAKAGVTPLDLREVRANSQAFGQYFDLGGFLQGLQTLAAQRGKPELEQAAKSCLEQLEKAIVAETHSEEYPGATGLTVELKRTGREYEPLQFANSAGWNRMVAQFSGSAVA